MADLDRNDVRGEANGSEEISKKDLLRETGISYGQFYRWKRMGLIPEVWFHRRSTFTGQETFLPRRKVLERIERIQELKDRCSLEEIAEMLAPASGRRAYARAELREMGIFGDREFGLLPKPDCDELQYLDVLTLMLIQSLSDSKLPDEQIRVAARTLLERFDELGDAAAERSLVVAERGGVSIALLHTGICLLDSGAEVAASVNLNKLIEDLNLRLRRE